MSQSARFAWDTQAAPILDEFVVVSASLPRPVVGDRCRVVGRAVIRKGAKSDSPKVGELEKGEVVVAEEFQVVVDKAGNGQVRVRFDRGWTSLLSKKGVWLLMKDHDDIEREVVHHWTHPREDAAAAAAAATTPPPPPPMIEHFCLPTGAELVTPEEKSVYSFVRTLDAGQRQYGYCVRLRATGGVETTADSVAVLCVLSQHPWFTIFESILAALEAQWLVAAGECDMLDGIVSAVFSAAAAKFPPPGGQFEVVLPPGSAAGGNGVHLSIADTCRSCN